MLVCYFGLSNGGLGAILCMHSPRQMRAVWSSRLLRLLAKQQLAAAHAYVCMRWQYSAGNTTLEWKYRIDCTVSCCLEYNNSSRFTFTVCPRNCPATAPQPIRINPGRKNTVDVSMLHTHMHTRAHTHERAVSSTHTQHIIPSFFKVKIACVGFQGEGGKDMHTQYNIQIIR